MTLRRLAVLLCLLSAAPAALAAEDADPLAGATAYQAGDFIGSADDLNAFVGEIMNARWQTDRSARVEGLVLTRDAGKCTLDGWIFLKDDVRGVVSQAQFFGKGRFELEPPIPMEKQQVRRFLGADAIDAAFKSASFTFTGVEDQKLFTRLDFQPDQATAAIAGNEDAKKWIEEVKKYWERGGPREDEAERIRYRQYFTALNLYERLLYPHREGTLEANLELDLGDARNKGRVQLVSLGFSYNPDDVEGVQVVGYWDHGRGRVRSLITRFANSGLYDEWGYAATSKALETRELAQFDLKHLDLRLELDPASTIDSHVRATADVEMVMDGAKAVAFYITPFLKTTAARLDGEAVGFVQPAIPERPWLHSPAIALLLPRPYRKGEVARVELELEGAILKGIDGGFTWAVLAEDDWFPRAYTGGFNKVSSTLDTTIITPPKFNAVSNGVVTKCRDEDLSPNRECWRYVTLQPIDFPFFNVGRNVKIDEGRAPDGTEIAVYTNMEGKQEFSFYDDNLSLQKRSYNLSKMGAGIRDKAIAAFTIYGEWFGPYPYGRFVATPHPKSHGRGSAGVLLLWSQAFLSPTARDEMASVGWRQPAERWFEFFVSHETAHQWWGNVAGIRGDRDQWFSEGFANYGAILYMEAIDQAKGRGRQWTMEELKDWHDFLTRDDGFVNTLAPLCLGNRVDSAENRDGYRDVRQPYMYGKGGFVLHMLRTVARALKQDPHAGDELFKTALRSFIKEQFLKHPSNMDMQLSFSRSYGFDLRWFFDQWVYGTGIPKVDFSYEIAKGADGQTLLRGRLKQRDTDFKFPIAVTLRYGKGKKKGGEEDPYFYTWAQQADQLFEVPLPSPPDEVAVNEELGVLAVVRTVPWQQAAAPPGGERAGQ
jgi:hypothetical protein